MLSKVDLVLELLGDGKWHLLKALKERAVLTEYQIAEVIAFLNEYGFVKIDSNEEKVKIATRNRFFFEPYV